MHTSDIDASVASGLGLYFLVLAVMNGIWTVKSWKAEKDDLRSTIFSFLKALLTVIMLGTSWECFLGQPLVLGQGFRDFMDWLMGPVVYFVLSVIGFVLVLWYREFFVLDTVAWIILDATLIFTGFSMTDADFRAIVAKPDNVPISMLIFAVGFTTWIALKQAVENDRRIAAGGKPLEAEGSGKVLTWPDLVYTELLAMLLCTVFLLVWSICLKAPLEPPASTTKIPNPSKAPWYFLGLQEMLVYFDPWLAGVVLPTYIIIGLCAIPYIDYNKKGNGYYTFKERPFAIITFLFGFVVLWVVLIVLGTFLRGPNWNFFGFFEYWSPYKTLALNNINLSDFFWLDILRTKRPDNWLAREWPGILLVLGYFLLIPMVLAKTYLREMAIKMGLVRYMVMVNVLLMMAFLPLKMVLRWSLNLKYIVFIPEYFFNI